MIPMSNRSLLGTTEILQNNQLNAQVAGLEVNEGDLLIFPGYLPHKVAVG